MTPTTPQPLPRNEVEAMIQLIHAVGQLVEQVAGMRTELHQIAANTQLIYAKMPRT
jgi:hypothetical protein